MSLFLMATSSTALSTAAFAGEPEDALIAKVVEAYGGDRLTNLRSIRVEDEFKTAFPGQGFTSGYVEFTTQKQDAQLDLANQRGSVEGWGTNWAGSNNNRTVSVEDDIIGINYLNGTYQPAAAPDYHTAFGAVIRVSDTLLAYELSKQAESAEHQGTSMYQGRPHELITFEMPSSPPMTLYVDSTSGLITKMARATGFGDLSYQFEDHQVSNGIGYAASMDFYVGSAVNFLTSSRKVTVNAVRPTLFKLDRNIEQEPTRVDTSEMTVDQVATGVHLVGTGNAYTAFIDAGDHIIAVGGYAGLGDRIAAYKETTGETKELRYQIATHHHTDHLGGMADAFAEGMTFISPANAVANLNTAAGETIPDDRIRILDEKMTLGPVEIYDITTNHAQSYALVYLPTSKTAFQVDHYGDAFADTVSPANARSIGLKNAIDALGIEVETLLSGHNPKATPWADFETAVAEFDPNPCPTNRAICR